MSPNIKNILSFFICFTILLSSKALSQWTQLNGPYGEKINSIAAKDSSIFIGTNGSMIYKTNNEGENWEKASNGFNYPYVSDMIFYDDTLIAAAKSSGLYKSTDYGKSWKEIPGAPKYVQIFSRNDTVLFSGSSSSGIYRSFDKAHTWECINPDDIANGQHFFINLMYAFKEMLFVSTNNQSFRSIDNGDTWENDNELKNISSMTHIEDTLIAGNHNLLFKSTDLGKTWQQINSDIPFSISIEALLFANQRLYIGTRTGILISEDNGKSCIPIDGFTANVNILKSANEVLFAGTKDGVFKSTDYGQHWSEANNGIYPRGINSIISNGSTLYTTGSHFGVFKINAFENEWNKLKIGLGENPGGFNKLFKFKDDIFLSSTWNIYSLNNNENSWNQLNEPENYLNSIVCSNDKIYANSSNINLYSSMDNGLSWDTVYCNDLPFTIESNLYWTLHYFNGYLFTANSDCGIYRSKDEGKNWLHINNGFPESSSNGWRFISIDDIILAGSSGYGILRSADSGTSWIKIDSGIKGTWITNFTKNDSLVFVSVSNDIYFSKDKGINWTLIKDGFEIESYITSLGLDDEFLYAGTEWDGMWRRSINEITSIAEKNDKSLISSIDIINIESNFIKLNIPHRLLNQNTNIEIISINGKKLKTITNINKQIININISDIAKGIYLINCKNKSGINYTKSFIKMK